MKDFLKKQREILAVIVYLALIAGLVYGVIIPVNKKIGQSRDKIQEEQIKQETRRKSIDDLPRIQDQYEILENENVSSTLLDKENAVLLIESLEKLASDSGNDILISAQEQSNVKNTSNKPKKGEENKNIVLPNENYLQLKITLGGNYNTIFKFINLLENFSYHGDVITMQIQKNANEIKQKNIFSQSGSGQGEKDGLKGELEGVLDVVFYTKAQ